MQDNGSPYLQISGLCKSYGHAASKAVVLDEVSTQLNAGEICVLLGPSGSGKSTFLNIVGGLEQADSGQVVVGERDIMRMGARELEAYRRRELGFVFQFYNLVPNLTIRENIEVGAHISDDPLPVDELLESLGLYEQQGKFPRQVSGGQQQRCAIGRALVKKPKLLLCDEPTGALDYQNSKGILSLIADVNERYGCTVLMVTHNDAISKMSHRMLRLRDGRLVEDAKNQKRIPAAELEW